ncbi:MAG: sigma-54-dependent Fis family transcriptional regulator [Myxococcales bacterium]|nr:sigma-54-dependent Fis family transcriptional regulator [Myxococcales bacterium]
MARPVAERPRILFVDDDPDLLTYLATAVADEVDAVTHGDPNAALDALVAEEFDAIVTDLSMPGMDGLELCRRALALRPELPVIVLSAHGRIDVAIAAVRAGAYDFVTKPPNLDVLLVVLQRAVERRRLQAELVRLRDRGVPQLPRMVGDSRAMREVADLVRRVARSESTVLVTGESGTGKELVARALHETSGRPGRFVAVNCAAMPEHLLESELFGHVRGAFTDARSARDGLFVEAHGGTLFLDEIGELPLAIQPKLLRVLQERTVRAVGGSSEVPVDVRIVAATNRDLEEEIEAKRFRSDLYFRIQVVEVPLPPLRMRGNDVLALATHFLRSHAGRADKGMPTLAPEAAARLLAHAWPGNVRELQNVIERAVALCRGDEIGPDDLPERLRVAPTIGTTESFVPTVSESLPTLEEVERRYVDHVLATYGGNKAVAARVLGIGRKTLYRKLERALEDKKGEESE